MADIDFERDGDAATHAVAGLVGESDGSLGRERIQNLLKMY